MSDHNKLLAKYHQKLRHPTKTTEPLNEMISKEPEKKAILNPFAKTSSTQDFSMDGPILPKVQTNQTPSYSFESMKNYNSSNEFVRMTTEIFPTLAISSSVSFPLACFLKPLGNSVQ